MAIFEDNFYLIIILIIVSFICMAVLVFVFTRPKKEKPPDIKQDLEELEEKTIVKKSSKKVVVKPESYEAQPTEDKENLKEFNYYSTNRQKNIHWLLDKWKRKTKRDRLIIINMRLNNGFYKMFIAVIKNDNSFNFQKKKYLVDDAMLVYDFTHALYMGFYSEDICIPYLAEIDKINFRKQLDENEKLRKIKHMVNPESIMTYSEAKLGQSLMQGHMLSDIFKKIMILLIITMVSTVFLLIYILFKTGAFQQVSGIF